VEAVNVVALYPFRFKPIYKERPWGGRNLERIHGTTLGGGRIGESWEISDREDAVSVIANGSLAGRSLRWLLENHRDDVLGNACVPRARFPLLVKIIDAQQPLSLQVHPPENLAASLHGEAKTELWYVAEARRGAEIFAGLRAGTTRTEFLARLRDGTVMDCIHRIAVAPGDAMLVPGGRVHALGDGIMAFEIQQNSDTTYRLFDWNRTDSSGRSRELQIESGLRCIDFSDYEPALIGGRTTPAAWKTLVAENAFRIELGTIADMREVTTEGGFMILGGVTGDFTVRWSGSRELEASLVCNRGMHCLVPASVRAVHLQGDPTARMLLIRPAPPQNGRLGRLQT
jgi:mannose-6-phosphate isomerase